MSTSSPTPVAAPTSTPNARKTESPNATPAVSGADHFDGTWSVSVVAPDQRDATGKVVRGFRSQYTVHVQNGVLRGEHKSHPSQRGYSAWIRIDGKIQPDGSADLHVSGISGDPIYSPAGDGVDNARVPAGEAEGNPFNSKKERRRCPKQ